ncbi:hypothetical protein GCM10027578_21450 [Spirosoma luteolum]
MSVAETPLNNDQLLSIIDQLGQLPSHTIGRALTNTIVIPNGRISSHHARLLACTPTTFLLEDLDSRNGTFVNGLRISRKLVGRADTVQLADATFSLGELLAMQTDLPGTVTPRLAPAGLPPVPVAEPALASPLDFTAAFAELQQVYTQYPLLRKACRNREKMIRTGSVVLSSVVGISAVVASGGTALPLLQVLSSAGLSLLVPTLCSTLLSTDEKLDLIDREYRERYRCPNPACRDPFGVREWDMLAQQKTCRRCQAIWVH